MSHEEILLEKVVDNGRPTPKSHVSRPRSIYLRFEPVSSGATTYSVMAMGDALQKYYDAGAGLLEGELTVDPADLHGAIVEVQELWRARVVGRREKRSTAEIIGPWEKVSKGEAWFPFAESWDLSDDRDAESRLQAVARPLAEVGYKLFRLLFHVGDEGLKKIGNALTAALAEDKQVITVQCNSLYAPWWMLYTPPVGQEDLDGDDDQPVPWEGFWGYSHIVEHNFKHSPAWKPCIAVDERGVIAGVNIDSNLDKEYPETPCIAPVIGMFKSIAPSTIVRETKRHLARDIKSSHYGDHIMYFGCHGTGVSDATGPAQAHLSLTDQQPIRNTDFIAWLDQTPLCTTPIVFVNACQGGQMSSLFYNTLGNELITRGANFLIGPQVDIPPVFAREYANSFFAQLASQESQAPGLAGDIFQQLAAEGLAERKNPLGLIMSLYRGIDSHICYSQKQDN